jgi:hypothetical protein
LAQDAVDTDSDEEGIYGIVYQITSPHLTDGNGNLKKYIGATTKTLECRFTQHKSASIRPEFVSSKVIIDAGDAKAEILECGRFANKHDLRVRERYFIELYRHLVVNIRIPSRGYIENNREYYNKHRDRLKSSKREKILCELCDVKISRSNLATHRASNKHISNQNALEALRNALAEN